MIEACPTCDRRIAKPIGPHIASTPWTDGCPCSDRATCISHQLGSDGPVRPSKEEMLQRATERHDSQMARYRHQCAQIEIRAADWGARYSIRADDWWRVLVTRACDIGEEVYRFAVTSTESQSTHVAVLGEDLIRIRVAAALGFARADPPRK